jgi:hypothetical protein
MKTVRGEVSWKPLPTALLTLCPKDLNPKGRVGHKENTECKLGVYYRYLSKMYGSHNVTKHLKCTSQIAHTPNPHLRLELLAYFCINSQVCLLCLSHCVASSVRSHVCVVPRVLNEQISQKIIETLLSKLQPLFWLSRLGSCFSNHSLSLVWHSLRGSTFAWILLASARRGLLRVWQKYKYTLALFLFINFQFVPTS